MKELIAAVIVATLAAGQAGAAERHPRTPHKFNFEQPAGGLYDSTS